jgi:uncharacterized membrane protein SpoIIM required for sporulation
MEMTTNEYANIALLVMAGVMGLACLSALIVAGLGEEIHRWKQARAYRARRARRQARIARR